MTAEQDITLSERIQDGDVFRWRYKDEKPEQLGAWGRYHCKSQIAIAKDGRLQDTYWGTSYGSHKGWSYADAERDLELRRLGNLSELEKRPEYEAVYFDDADCVDLSHANSSKGNFYVRKGAARSRDKMRATLVERISRFERDISFAQSRLERAREQLASIERGIGLDEVYL